MNDKQNISANSTFNLKLFSTSFNHVAISLETFRINHKRTKGPDDAMACPWHSLTQYSDTFFNRPLFIDFCSAFNVIPWHQMIKKLFKAL